MKWSALCAQYLRRWYFFIYSAILGKLHTYSASLLNLKYGNEASLYGNFATELEKKVFLATVSAPTAWKNLQTKLKLLNIDH